MERFLERVSVSEYRNNFILKGGMLVASIVGVDMRSTMDIDTTVKALPLNEKDARAIIERNFTVTADSPLAGEEIAVRMNEYKATINYAHTEVIDAAVAPTEVVWQSLLCFVRKNLTNNHCNQLQ